MIDIDMPAAWDRVVLQSPKNSGTMVYWETMIFFLPKAAEINDI
jgi:hypothetical protein